MALMKPPFYCSQVGWREVRARVCVRVCVDPIASWHSVISAALLILLKTMFVCVSKHRPVMCPSVP